MTQPVGAVRWWALVAVVVLVSAVAVWIVSPRFAIETPSVVDDWSAISKTQDQLRALVKLENPEEERFRPGWIVWNYLQWHTLDAPGGLIGPNAWNVALRIAALVAGLSLLTLLALPRPRSVREAIVYAGLAGIPALLVLTVPKFGVDLARFGPQEPLLVGGMALGGSLLVIVACRLLDELRPVSLWKIGLAGAAGVALWLLGVYQKETSIAALPLVVSVLYAGRARRASWVHLSRARHIALWVLGAVVVLPFVHIATETARIVARGDLVYEAEVDAGRGVVDGLHGLYDWSHEALPLSARLAMLAAVVLTALAAGLRRKVDAVALGALASGVLWFVLTAQSGTVATRYYLPAYALFAVALSLSLSRLPRPVPVIGLSLLVLYQAAVVFVVELPYVPSPGGREEVELWVEREQRSGELIRAVAGYEAAGCVVAVAGLGKEESDALPVLVALELEPGPEPGRDRCEPDETYLVIGPLDEGTALARVCVPGAARHILDESGVATLDACAELRSGVVRDPTFGPVAPRRLVELRRLRL